MATLIAPANNPQTTNAMNGRLTLEVPTYPNSGCQTRTRDTTNSTCPEPSSPYHSGSGHAGKLHYRELRRERQAGAVPPNVLDPAFQAPHREKSALATMFRPEDH